MASLSILYYTANTLNATFLTQTQVALREAADRANAEIIAVGRQPMDFGDRNFVFDPTIPICNWAIYRQMFMAAQAARTPWVACAEDDAFYAPEHFLECPRDALRFWYDDNRWQLYTWLKEPIFCTKPSHHDNIRPVAWILNCSRDLLLRNLTDRFRRYPDPLEHNTPNDHWMEPGRPEEAEIMPGWPLAGYGRWRCSRPSVVVLHAESLGQKRLKPGHVRRMQTQRADELYRWGRADALLDKIGIPYG